ncbi:serine/threonine-protein kinase/endoribonuclease IRE1a-like [Tasmannia lanceolata]|uniref:serine/threonine-protein kinase/endoribonuclease IRE1a-like n=1 Tax=Tasmannia lanceolata TaxID=3420 RepID=UPI004062DD84
MMDLSMSFLSMLSCAYIQDDGLRFIFCCCHCLNCRPPPLRDKGGVDWDVVNGLVYLHENRIVHRDLKLYNILISTNELASTEGLLRAKLSDMGLSKRLPRGMTSFSHSEDGHGSLGWVAPEIAEGGHQTNAVDLSSLGCVLFVCISGGEHPFGLPSVRANNIESSNLQLFPIDHNKEAVDVISSLLNPKPKLRPKAITVMRRPLLWNSEKRMSFLQDVSDKVESERQQGKVESERQQQGPLSSKIERMVAIKRWDRKLGFTVIQDISSHRR